MLRRAVDVIALSVLLIALAAPGRGATPSPSTRPAVVDIEDTWTSIYIGRVSLTMQPFVREGDTYTSQYHAKVFPFFFYNERGSISIDFPADSLHRLQQGNVVHFTGHATNRNGDGRRIAGRAVPDGTGSDHGRIKVRVWVGKIELIFNTTYRFAASR